MILPVKTMSDEDLLHTYRSNMMHAGDDFSLTEYTDEDANEANMVEKEILRRMGMAGPHFT